MSTESACHGQVLYLEKSRQLPDKLEHGEVLVHMLAASITEEDLLRVQVVTRVDSPTLRSQTHRYPLAS